MSSLAASGGQVISKDRMGVMSDLQDKLNKMVDVKAFSLLVDT